MSSALTRILPVLHLPPVLLCATVDGQIETSSPLTPFVGSLGQLRGYPTFPSSESAARRSSGKDTRDWSTYS